MIRLNPGRAADLRSQWDRSGGSLRIPSFLDDDEAAAMHGSLAELPYTLAWSSVELFQYYRHDHVFDADCDHALCRLGRWLHGDGCRVVGEITGLDLVPPANEPYVTASLYVKGSYLDPHNDFGLGRAVAYVFGFTTDAWPAEEGGWLEFLDADDAGKLVERRPPGWNTLDLFDVRAPNRWHQVSLVREHRVRLAVSGWFYPR